jgi:hypothetical protein
MAKVKCKPWDALDRARAARAIPNLKAKPPEGSFTVKEYAARYGLGVGGAQRQIDNLTGLGVLKRLGVFGPKKAGYYQLVPPKEL